jgi:hypothetical protein
MGGYWDAALTQGLAPKKSKWPRRWKTAKKAGKSGWRLAKKARRSRKKSL